MIGLRDGPNSDTITRVASRVETLVAEMRANPIAIRFEDAVRVASHYFGKPRRRGGSHVVWKMPWPLDPRVNLQRDNNGKAKAYQVRQLLEAINRLSQQRTAKGPEAAEADAGPSVSAGKKRKR